MHQYCFLQQNANQLLFKLVTLVCVNLFLHVIFCVNSSHFEVNVIT